MDFNYLQKLYSSSKYHWDSEEDLEIYKLEASEYDKTHDSMLYENKLRQIVISGDVEEMKAFMTEEGDLDRENALGELAVSEKKKTEYLIVSLIVIISRAAVEGGMLREEAYALSDVYMRKLEHANTIEEMLVIGGKAQLDFTQKVSKAKEERSRLIYIEECKDYVAKNLRKPFKVGDIAPAIGVNRSYLARKFSELEGVTIQQYIMQERCRHAANLLKYTNYPISIISEYFCFSSQSHFGKQFKMLFDMTPNEYRSRYKTIETYSANETTFVIGCKHS